MAVVESGDGLHQRPLPAVHLPPVDRASLAPASVPAGFAAGLDFGDRQIVLGEQTLNMTGCQRGLIFGRASLDSQLQQLVDFVHNLLQRAVTVTLHFALLSWRTIRLV